MAFDLLLELMALGISIGIDRVIIFSESGGANSVFGVCGRTRFFTLRHDLIFQFYLKLGEQLERRRMEYQDHGGANA